MERPGVGFGPANEGMLMLMKKLGIAMAIAIAAVGAAHAADLPTKKEAPPAPPVNCFASIWTWLELDAGRLSAELGPLHRLRDA